jgi:hypothetical protein
VDPLLLICLYLLYYTLIDTDFSYVSVFGAPIKKGVIGTEDYIIILSDFTRFYLNFFNLNIKKYLQIHFKRRSSLILLCLRIEEQKNLDLDLKILQSLPYHLFC